jgi:hypothetical protein
MRRIVAALQDNLVDKFVPQGEPRHETYARTARSI